MRSSMPKGNPGRPRGLTLIELMVVIAVAGVLLTLAAPGFRDLILMQRLKGVNAQLVTDMQFARAEAAARSQWVRVSFRSSPTTTCYTIYTSPTNATRCNCLEGIGNACADPMREIRTVQVQTATGVRVNVLPDISNEFAFAFDHITGAISSIPADRPSAPIPPFRIQTSIDAERVLRTVVGRAGRVTVCAPASASVGAPPC